MRIEDRYPGTPITESGYYRMLGHAPSALLMQKAHSCCIGNGNELEALIYEFARMPKSNKVKYNKATFYEKENELIVKCKIGKENFQFKKGIDPDVLVFKGTEVYVCEIKDGQNFDTKKASGEIDKLTLATQLLEKNDPLERKYIPKIVLWNCNDLGTSSFKDKRVKEQGMLLTGRQFAELVNINYKALNRRRNTDQEANRKFLYNQFKNGLKSLKKDFPQEFASETIL